MAASRGGPSNNHFEAECTIIGPQIEVRANVQGNGELRVFGALEGSVELDGGLSIEDGALLRADVIANQIEISGIAIGQIQAHESIVLTASARVVGSLIAPNIQVTPGAQLRGPIRTSSPERRDDQLSASASQKKSAAQGRSPSSGVSEAAARAAAASAKSNPERSSGRGAERSDAEDKAPKRRHTRRVIDEAESTAVVRHPDVSATEAEGIEIPVTEASESVDAKLPARGKKRAAARR